METGTMDRMKLEFHADTGGTFPMTWSQQEFWRKKIRAYSHDASRHFNLPLFIDLPDDITADQAMVAVAFRRLVERNEVLRSHFLDGPEGIRQRVEQAGTIDLLVCQAPPEASRSRAEALAAELATVPFDHATEWGIRLALVCAGGTPRHLAFAFSHMMTDGGGILALLNDFFGLLRGQADASEPDRPWQPTDQLLREQSDRGARRNQAAIRYWRKQLERMPPSLFPWPAVPAQLPRFHRLHMNSRALAVAAARLAASCQVSVPSVVLAGTALMLSALNGQPTCAMAVVASNRFDADIRAMVGIASQDGLFVADFNGGTVAEAVRTVHRSVQTALYYGHYDPCAMADLVDTIETQRGVRLDLSAMYNDLSRFVEAAEETGAGQAVATPDGEADARELLAETVITPESTWEGQLITMYLSASPGRDTCGLLLVADTACLPPPVMEALLLGIEKIVTEAAYRDIAVADIPALTGITR
ncbi:MAG: hypothetical protein JWM19_3396 [Actinomycetia bacterium]|nr:hypothetical protein [Actinomycetes bacterium]